jgi:hypothetical protein
MLNRDIAVERLAERHGVWEALGHTGPKVRARNKSRVAKQSDAIIDHSRRLDIVDRLEEKTVSQLYGFRELGSQSLLRVLFRLLLVSWVDQWRRDVQFMPTAGRVG